MATANTPIQIKPVKGFRTPDGVVHDTAKQAQQHVTDQAIKEQLKAFVDKIDVNTAGVSEGSGGDALCVYVTHEDLGEFLFEHREVILAALQPQVTVRQIIRKPRAKKAAPAAAGAQE